MMTDQVSTKVNMMKFYNLYSLDPSRNQNKGSGVGLGLPIAKEIAEGHGGFKVIKKVYS